MMGNQQKGESDCRKYFMINFQERISFLEVDHEIFSTVIQILSLLLIQEGQLLVSGKNLGTSTG